jgi:hypothetical protein
MCVVDVGAAVAGKAVKSTRYCVLCLRFAATQAFREVTVAVNAARRLNYYVNIASEYPTEKYLDYLNTKLGQYRGITGPFLEYSPGDYRLTTPTSVEQLFKTTPPSDNANCLFETVYDVDNCQVTDETSMNSEKWELCHCPTPTCKLTLLSFKEIQYAIGIGNTQYNLIDNTMACNKCQNKTATIVSNPWTNMICFNGSHITRCFFCHTLVDFSPRRTVQCCVECSEENYNEGVTNKMVCARCNNAISSSKRSGGVNIYKVSDEAGEIREAYLCRRHRLKREQCHSEHVFTSTEFEGLIN